MVRCSLTIDDGHRRLFAVRHGPYELGPPRALYDAGAFGIYADGDWVGRSLADLGIPMVSYSRAGLYKSDPVPDGVVPDPFWHADDMARLLDACEVTQPVLLIAHSMAGLRAHGFAARYPERVGAVLLIDAVTPVQLGWSVRRNVVRSLARSISVCSQAARGRATRSLLRLYPNFFDLDGEAHRDKMASWADPGHLLATKAEILAATDPALKDRLVPITHCPIASVAATVVASGDKMALGPARATGRRTERLEWPGVGHAKILSPQYARQLATLGASLLA